jgi:hypothetical protein
MIAMQVPVVLLEAGISMERGDRDIMKIEFDDGTIMKIDENQEDWTLKIQRGSNETDLYKWKGLVLETSADKPKILDIINLGPEWRQLRHYGTGYPHKYNEYEGGWKPL